MFQQRAPPAAQLGSWPPAQLLECVLCCLRPVGRALQRQADTPSQHLKGMSRPAASLLWAMVSRIE